MDQGQSCFAAVAIKFRQVKALIQPIMDAREYSSPQASRLRLTTISSPRTWTWKDFQRTRRRTGDISPVQVVHAVMAGAPDFVQVAAILNRAAQVRADSGYGVIFALGGHQQQRGASSEPENLRAIGFQVTDLGGDHFVSAKVHHARRNEIAQYGVKKRHEGGK